MLTKERLHELLHYNRKRNRKIIFKQVRGR